MPVAFGEPVDQLDLDGEGELLTGDGVGQAFEQAREPRRLDASEPLRQRAQMGVVLRSAVEVAQVGIEAEPAPKGSR
jgi:hypothetical protein